MSEGSESSRSKNLQRLLHQIRRAVDHDRIGAGIGIRIKLSAGLRQAVGTARSAAAAPAERPTAPAASAERPAAPTARARACRGASPGPLPVFVGLNSRVNQPRRIRRVGEFKLFVFELHRRGRRVIQQVHDVHQRFIFAEVSVITRLLDPWLAVKSASLLTSGAKSVASAGRQYSSAGSRTSPGRRCWESCPDRFPR